MKFHLIDKIEQINPGKEIIARKTLSLAEEYLADHFPIFPVMPGVLMLEALVQAAAWLVRIEQNFSKSIVVLTEARNVRYGNFVTPGRALTVRAELINIDGNLATFKGTGAVDENQQAVQGRFILRSFNVADIAPSAGAADERIIAQLKERFKLIGGPDALEAYRETSSQSG